MNYQQMPKRDVFEFVQNAYKTEKIYIILVLTDGLSFCGKLPTLFIDSEEVLSLLLAKKEQKELSRMKKDCLPLENTQVSREYLVYIPLEQIAGLSATDFYQNHTEETTGKLKNGYSGEYLTGSAKETLFEELLNIANIRSFEARKLNICYRLTPHKAITWSEISFKADTPLYCDWDFMNITSGGLTSIGGSFTIGFSAGWKKSLWSMFRKKIKESTIDLLTLTSNTEGTVSGYVNFFDFSQITPSQADPILNMEGEKWYPALVTDKKIRTIAQVKKSVWAIAYFKQNAFMYPKNQWENFSQEIKIFGEIVPVNLTTEFGATGCFIKVRAAAFVN